MGIPQCNHRAQRASLISSNSTCNIAGVSNTVKVDGVDEVRFESLPCVPVYAWVISRVLAAFGRRCRLDGYRVPYTTFHPHYYHSQVSLVGNAFLDRHS